MRIRELPPAQQPARRLAAEGPEALSDAELLALVSGQQDLDICRSALQEYQDWIGLLRADVRSLAASIGTARKAALIKACLEIARRLTRDGYPERFQVRSPADAAKLLISEMAALDQEELWVLNLDTKSKLLKLSKVYRGSLNTAMVRLGELFKDAVRLNAASVLVCHNHPSMDPTPSPEDILLTRQIGEAGKVLDIELIDHLIVAGGQYVSLRERGFGFSS